MSEEITIEGLVAKQKAEQERFLRQNVSVEKTGAKIILPEKMSYEQAIKALQLKEKEENTTVSVYEEVDAHPLDGAYAFMKAMQRTYGWSSPVPTETFFGPIPPQTVSLEIAHGVYTQIIWGQFQIPTIKGQLSTKAGKKDGRRIFVIGGEILKKHQDEVKELADLTRKIAKEESIYKGKAIRLKTTDNGDLNENEPPNFMDLSRVNPEELVFPDDIQQQVETNLFTPIKRTAECKQYGIPLKRGVLFEGPYGTGKTLAAYTTAKHAEDNGWTFIYLDKVGGLKEAILFARRYGPSVIFAEDIDRVMTGGRTVAVDDILNNIDGIDSKNTDILIVLTTNHVEKIEKAMLRPGRLDAVISVRAPDAKAAQKLIHLYARGLLNENEPLDEVGQELDGQIPAMIREVVERAKLYAVSNLKDGEKLKLKAKDLLGAARGIKNHLELTQTKKATEKSVSEQLGDSMTQVFETSVPKVIMNKLDKLEKRVSELN